MRTRRSNDEGEPAEEEVKQEDGVEGELLLPLGDEFAQERQGGCVAPHLHTVDQKKLRATSSSFTKAGRTGPRKAVASAARLIGNTQ